MGPAFLPYAGPVFERCNNIIHQSLLQYQQYQQNSELDEPDKAFLVVALDLLSGLIQGLTMSLEPLIRNCQPNLLSLLTICLKHPQAPVRQSAYALVGDLAMGCFPLLRPAMPGIMQELIMQLDPEPKFEFVSASNNAAWSVGEVALRYGRGELQFQWHFFTSLMSSYVLQMIPSSNNGFSLSSQGWFLFFCIPRPREAFMRTLPCLLDELA